MGKFYDITGIRFGRLTVIKRVPNKSTRTSRWLCKCDCGKVIESNKNNLINGHTKSCGCYAASLSETRKTRTTHDQSRTRLYHIWQGIKQRCYDKNTIGYKHYGDKGVKMCPEWLDFNKFSEWAFNNGYSENLTVDRKNNMGNYEPNNCRWISTKEQNRNKRNHRIIELNEVVKCVGEWSELLGIPTNTIINRLNKGCTAEEALNTNYRRRKLTRIKSEWGAEKEAS